MSVGRLRSGLFTASMLLPALALGLPEVERGAWTGGSSTSDLAVSLDGRYVATSQRSTDAGLAIWDRLAPDEGPTLVDVCEATTVAFTSHATRGDAFYVGCGDDRVLRVVLDSDVVPPTARVEATIVVGTDVETVVSVDWAEDDTVLHVVTSESNLFRLHRVDLASDAVDGASGLPTATSGVAADLAVAAGGTPVLIGQTDGSLFWASRSSTAYSSQETTPLSGTVSAIAVDPSGSSDVFLLALASRGEVWTFSVASPGATPTLLADGLGSPQAMAFVDDGGAAPVAFIAGSDAVIDVFEMDGTHLRSIALGSASAPLAVAPDRANRDTVYVAGGDGSVRVLTTRPWVSEVSAEPETVGAGETVTVSFTLDAAASWTLRAGSGLSSSGGTSLATGEAEEPGVVSVLLAADDLPDEGENRLVVFATAGGATGLNSTIVTVDTPPDAVTGVTATAGQERIVLAWMSSDESDIATYRVVLSDAAFTSSTEPLPALSILDIDDASVDYPRDVDAGEPDSAHSLEVTGLENGRAYWLAVVPVDEAGNEGPLSAVVSATPAATCGLVECTGDTGCACTAASVAAGPSAAGFGLLGIALWARRRRP